MSEGKSDYFSNENCFFLFLQYTEWKGSKLTGKTDYIYHL